MAGDAAAKAGSPLLTVLFPLAAVVVFASCATFQDVEGVRPHVPTPSPPAELLNLPREALTLCHDDPALDQRGVNPIWEFPGIEPIDPNSAYMGRRGRQLGTLDDCSFVLLTEFAWSQTDREFWVKIRGPNGEEGWVTLDLLTFRRSSPKAP